MLMKAPSMKQVTSGKRTAYTETITVDDLSLPTLVSEWSGNRIGLLRPPAEGFLGGVGINTLRS